MFRRCCLAALQGQLFGPCSDDRQIWDRGLASRLVAEPDVCERHAGLLALIETPQAMEGYLKRAVSQDYAKRRANRCIEAVQEATQLARSRGWLD